MYAYVSVWICMYVSVWMWMSVCVTERCEICVELSILSSDSTSFNKASEGWCQWPFCKLVVEQWLTAHCRKCRGLIASSISFHCASLAKSVSLSLLLPLHHCIRVLVPQRKWPHIGGLKHLLIMSIWSRRWFLATTQVLGNKCVSSGKATSGLRP